MNLIRKKPRFESEDRVRAIQSFGTQHRTVRVGDVLRGDDPLVIGSPDWFEDVNTPTEERRNVWTEMPEPPTHAPAVEVRTIEIPVHRRVVAVQDVAAPTGYAPGSEGERLQREGRMNGPPFARSLLRRGQICDLLSDIVKSNPGLFEHQARAVTHEDIARAQRLAQLEEE